jgi:hypothetical protein
MMMRAIAIRLFVAAAVAGVATAHARESNVPARRCRH